MFFLWCADTQRTCSRNSAVRCGQKVRLQQGDCSVSATRSVHVCWYGKLVCRFNDDARAFTFIGIITIFCDELGWTNMALLFEQFQSRLMFGVQRELMELMKIQYLTARQARLLYQGGYPNLAKLATADKIKIQDILQNSAPFQRLVQAESGRFANSTTGELKDLCYRR